jgi:hypothetical protein
VRYVLERNEVGIVLNHCIPICSNLHWHLPGIFDVKKREG